MVVLESEEGSYDGKVPFHAVQVRQTPKRLEILQSRIPQQLKNQARRRDRRSQQAPGEALRGLVLSRPRGEVDFSWRRSLGGAAPAPGASRQEGIRAAKRDGSCAERGRGADLRQNTAGSGSRELFLQPRSPRGRPQDHPHVPLCG